MLATIKYMLRLVLLIALILPDLSLANNNNDLYTNYYEGFWKQWRESKTAAIECASDNRLTDFLIAANENKGNAEISEANAQEIENLSVANPECVLRNLQKLQISQRAQIIRAFLANPIFVSRQDILKAFKSIWDSGRYLELRTVYETETSSR